jgi:hypothetical protein
LSTEADDDAAAAAAAAAASSCAATPGAEPRRRLWSEAGVPGCDCELPEPDPDPERELPDPDNSLRAPPPFKEKAMPLSLRELRREPEGVGAPPAFDSST